MADQEVKFGYTMKVVAAGHMPRKITWVCTQCGSDDVEARFYCVWDVKKQQWVTDNQDEEGDYCRDCGDQVELESRNI